MKKFFTILGCSLILLSSCNKETIKGGGAVISENRIVPAFAEIQINGDGEATVVYGLTQEVTVTGYENLLPVYETKMLGSVLQLQFKPNNYRIRNNNIKVRSLFLHYQICASMAPEILAQPTLRMEIL